MAKSIVVDVRKALIAGLRAEFDASDFESVSCTYGWQGGDDTARRDQVFTDRARADHDAAALKAGRNFRNEQMEFSLVILALGVGMRPEDLDDHVMELGQIVEEYIADNKSGETFGIEGLNWIRVSGMELKNQYASEGSLSELTYTITYDARLT